MQILPEALTMPPRTLTGPGALDQLPGECFAFGKRGVLVHGRSFAAGGRLVPLLESFAAGGDVASWRHPGGEPTLDQLRELIAFARGHQADWIAAIGGGSVMDVAKACAGLLKAPLGPQAYHQGEPLPPADTPFLVAPTTAGTGSEATIVSVLTDEAHGLKKSIRHATHMARTVILDPGLLDACPPHVIAGSGMDALTQAIESFISKGATWFSDTLAEEAIRRIDASLLAAHAGERGERAADLLIGSYLAGLALSHARLGIVHGLAHPLGCRFHAAHGLVCGVCLPHALAFNRDTVREKYDRLQALLGDDPIDHARELLSSMEVASPFAGKAIPDLEAVITETLASGSTKANPRPVAADDVRALLQEIFA